MISIFYSPGFVRKLKLLDKDLQNEVIEKVELFKKVENHKGLRVHKLHGLLKSCRSFSVNYKTRIVFEYLSKYEVVFHSVGDHDMYK